MIAITKIRDRKALFFAIDLGGFLMVRLNEVPPPL
jgi:hypothetical protein